jgi:sigma-B regulation protein RsbU (phosphoserine phosphatase)
VLGVQEDFTYDEQKIEICPGDFLLLYTDGITEAENTLGQQFGEERLNGLVCGHKVVSIADFPEMVLNEIRRFSGRQELADDATVIGLRKT